MGGLVSLSLGAALVVALFAAWLFIHSRQLSVRLKRAEESVTQTSRLLIQKNVELFDRSLKQQGELAKKDDFVAIASHQLRTPLNEVIWALGELIDTCKDQALKDSYQRIFDSAKRMQKIIEDLLAFVQVEQSKTRQSVALYDADPVILGTVQRLQADFRDSGITIGTHLSFGKSINAIDTASLEMITSNLIENAYHYTPAPGNIRVTTRRLENDNFELEVSDSGIGIPADMINTMFTKFRRAPSAVARNKGGSGLGLYVIKSLLDLAGGSISFDSTEGKGTTFHVRLPKSSVSMMPVAAPPSLNQAAH